MKYIFNTNAVKGFILLQQNEAIVSQNFYANNNNGTTYTIAWNRGQNNKIKIDEIWHSFPQNTILPIMHDQCFLIENAVDIVLWQFNSDFYCIVNHDAEVGCVGFIFYGPKSTMFIDLLNHDVESMNKMCAAFEEEFNSDEEIKDEMLRTLLVRLIIKITRLAKKQYIGVEEIEVDKFNLIRKFHLLVELHYKVEHKVSFYANLLHKSPKTVSNYFALYSKKTPLKVIHERIVEEAKRLILYTDMSMKEIANELGFDNTTHFSKFFKNNTMQSPSELRNRLAN
jgi:AraC-like DNA-binding protein